LGAPAITGAARTAADGFGWVAAQVHPRWSIGRVRRIPGPVTPGAGSALLATVAALGLLALLAYQLYDLKDPYPGIVPPARQVLGKAIVPEGCWSWLLGAIWRPEDDLRFIYDSSFEQIAYGTFPWGVLGPVAMLVLLRDRDPRKRLAGALTLAWAGGAWIATEAFQRKAGATIYGGFPALAVAIGVWLDGVLARRTATPATADTVEASVAEPVAGEPAPAVPMVERRSAVPAGAFLLALFVALAVLDLGKDLQSFAEKLTSLLTGGESIAYPKQSRLFGLPTKLWVLVLGMLAALGFVTTLVVWRIGESAVATNLRRIARWGLAVSLGATIALAAFWAYGWQPRLADHLSSKAMFETYRELRQPADQLVMMGDLGHAPLAYADTTPEKVQTREQIVTALKRPNRVFAIAPQAELCSLHREIGDKPYFVVDDRNTRNLLLSNRVDGTTDKNPLASMIAHEPPEQIQYRPKGPVIWDNKIELLGWSIPKTVRRSTKFEVTLYYKILAPVGGNWTSIMHFDGAIRFSGDHKPIKDRCPTSTWQPGDYIIDQTTVVAGGAGHPLGRYDLWIGFFTGSAPNFRNMTISTAPGDIRDTTDRVKITSVILD
ncbi:MAG: hypothetical protein M3619_33365, partial [Myxococcota bacterium]|nr:hypothetical protein [Myxococcota bacterium]